MRLNAYLLIALLAMVRVTAAAAAGACSPSDIQVMQADVHHVEGYVHAVGEIRNQCSIAVGAELQVIFRDANGRVVSAHTFWPDSINNIPAADAIAFDTMDLDSASITSLTVKVLEVKEWRR